MTNAQSRMGCILAAEECAKNMLMVEISSGNEDE